MPGLSVFLSHLMEKFPEIGGRKIGISYASDRGLSGELYQIRGESLEGGLQDSAGNFWNYIINVNENMKYSDNLIKVGAIAEALSAIHLHEKNEREAKPLKQIGIILFGYNKLTEKITYDMQENEIGSRGLGRPHGAFRKYEAELKDDKIEVLVPEK